VTEEAKLPKEFSKEKSWEVAHCKNTKEINI